MNRELAAVRYGLIIFPACIAIYVNDYNNERFTLDFLILLLVVVLSNKLPKPYQALASCLELFCTAWLCLKYGSLMMFPAVSAMLFYSFLQPPAVPAVYCAIHLLLLNIAFAEYPPLPLVYLNLTYVLAAALSLLLRRSGHGREQTLHLYDELRKQHFELDEARDRLLQFAAQVENAAQAEERVRISRQLHDDIGHRLIRVKMMMEAAIHLLPSSPDSGLAMMEQIRDQLAASMDDMRAAVKRIHSTPQREGAYALDRLLEETGRDTGIVTSYIVKGAPYPLYPSVQVVLYKNAQEAITNALRHGLATSISLTLRYDPAEVTMEIANNGLLPVNGAPLRPENSGGLGMKGMSERTGLLGGTLELSLEPQYTVITRLPVYKKVEIS